jgi:hypothetical protein
MTHYIYLDDVRTPVDPKWIVVRSYEEFINKINELGFENIKVVSLDHDLGPESMNYFFEHTSKTGIVDYNKFNEKTGYDCAKWLVENWLNGKPTFEVLVHSANPIGSTNIMGYINNYRYFTKTPQNCFKVNIPHT